MAGQVPWLTGKWHGPWDQYHAVSQSVRGPAGVNPEIIVRPFLRLLEKALFLLRVGDRPYKPLATMVTESGMCVGMTCTLHHQRGTGKTCERTGKSVVLVRLLRINKLTHKLMNKLKEFGEASRWG